MNVIDYNKLRNNRYKRNTHVHIARSNPMFKIGVIFTVLGLDKSFRKDFRETYFKVDMTETEKKSYDKERELQWKQVIQSLDLGHNSDKSQSVVYTGWMYN